MIQGDLVRRSCSIACFSIAALAIFFLRHGRNRLREAHTKCKWDAEEKAWKVSGYREVCLLIKRPEIRANYMPSFMEGLCDDDRNRFDFLQSFFLSWPLFQDGESQVRIHRILAAQFSALKLEGQMRDVVDSVVDEMISTNIGHGGTWDLVDSYAKRLPLRVIIDVLGFSRADEHQLQEWADVVEEWFGGRGDPLPRFLACQAALKAFWERAERLLQQDLPEHCIAAELKRAGERGELRASEVIPNLFFLMAAGHETTSGFIANSILLILKDSSLEREVRECLSVPGFSVSCARYENIMEELLRYTSPIKCMYREVGEDFEWEQLTFKRGQPIHFLNHAANRDPAVFPSPDAILPKRRNARQHLVFGTGPHVCPGLRLGRLMGKLAIAALLQRMPSLRLAAPPEHILAAPLDSISALTSLPVKHF